MDTMELDDLARRIDPNGIESPRIVASDDQLVAAIRYALDLHGIDPKVAGAALMVVGETTHEYAERLDIEHSKIDGSLGAADLMVSDLAAAGARLWESPEALTLD